MPSMKKYRRREVCFARRLKDDEAIVGTNGRVDAAEGDWVVTQELGGNSHTYVLTDSDFRRDWVEWRIMDDDDEEEKQEEKRVVVETEEEVPLAPVESVETPLPETQNVRREDEEERELAPITTEEVVVPETYTRAADHSIKEDNAPVHTVEIEVVETTENRGAIEINPDSDAAPVEAVETDENISAPTTLNPPVKIVDRDVAETVNNDAEAAVEADESDKTKRATEKRRSLKVSGNAPETAEQPTIPPVGDSLETNGPVSNRP